MSDVSKNSKLVYLLSPDLKNRFEALCSPSFSLSQNGQDIGAKLRQELSALDSLDSLDSKEVFTFVILSTEYLRSKTLDLSSIAKQINASYLIFFLLTDDLKYAEKILKTTKAYGAVLPSNMEPEYLFSFCQNLLSQMKSNRKLLKFCANLETNRKKHEKEKLMLLNISRALARERDFDLLLSLILNEVRRAVCADAGSIYTVEDSGPKAKKRLRFKQSALFLERDEFTLPIDRNSIAGYVALTGQPLLIKNVYNMPPELPFSFNPSIDRKHNYHTKSMLVLPMINQLGDIMGIIQLINRKKSYTQKLSTEEIVKGGVLPFSREDYQIASAIANQSAIALYNKKLIEGQQNLLESFIGLIDGAIDAKSKYTGSHCHRVPILTEMLTMAVCDCNESSLANFSLNEDEWYELRIAAGLHDCGKILTPVHIMDKSTKLETIFDRIALIHLRFELLCRDAKDEYLQAVEKGEMEEKESQSLLKKRLQEIEDMKKFIERVNIGGEFLDEEDITKIKQIGQEKYRQNGNLYPLVSENEIYNLSTSRGTLTKEERIRINGHMVETVKMLEALPFPMNLERVPEYACGHHEKMDGTGYPRGIYGGDMSIPARIMAIADVFEALTAEDRPYKKGKSLSEAMEIMGKMKENNHFDPEIFDVFIKSKVYKIYAEKYMSPKLIDHVDEERLLRIKAKEFTLPPKEERMRRWETFLPEYQFLNK